MKKSVKGGRVTVFVAVGVVGDYAIVLDDEVVDVIVVSDVVNVIVDVVVVAGEVVDVFANAVKVDVVDTVVGRGAS